MGQDLLKQLKLTKLWIGKEEHDAVRKVLDSGWLTEGEVTKQFERKVAEYVGAKYAVAVCNCTVALTLCLKALSNPTDGFLYEDVRIPSFTHSATACAVINAGQRPVLCDVELDSYNIYLGKVDMNNIGCVPVSWGGNPLSYELNGNVVEDAACSLGSVHNGVKTGCGDHLTCFSFHPRKIITTGEGGMVTTNDREMAESIRAMKHFGVGNYKLSDVNSAIGLAQMEKIDRIIEKRIWRATIYNTLLARVPSIITPTRNKNSVHTYQTYAVYIKNRHRDRIISSLAKKGIEAQIGTYALHLLPQFRNVERVGTLENSEKLYRHLLALPMAYDLTEEDQKRVVDELKYAIA